MATEDITHTQIIELMRELHEQVLETITGFRIELKGDIQRLEYRQDQMQESLDQVRQTQLEDSAAFTSVFVNHDHRIKILERWRGATKSVTKCG